MDIGELFVMMDLERRMLMWFVSNLAIDKLTDMEMLEHWGKNSGPLIENLYAYTTFNCDLGGGDYSGIISGIIGSNENQPLCGNNCKIAAHSI